MRLIGIGRKLATAFVGDEPNGNAIGLMSQLWNGNVVSDTDGRAWLVDPAAYVGHREMDLEMMSLFGLPNLARVLAAYDKASPLARGFLGLG